jgi:NAD(P)-dependent dehydrogenase (short-subunit alcohol dehydrogenase family)
VSGFCSLAGRTGLVTGGGSGPGLGIAEVLAERGAAVAVNDVVPELSAAAVDAIVAAGGKAVAAPFDITDYEAVIRGIRRAEEQLAPVDILVNNVGMLREPNKHIPFVESGPEDWRPWFEVNVFGALHCLRCVLPGMVERRWGRVITISTALAARGLDNRESMYGGSKAGIEGVMRNVAMEVVRDGVTVNNLAISLTTNVYDKADRAIIDRTLKTVPMGRLLEPREAGYAVAWLASDEAAAVTAQTQHVNGGVYQGR